LNLKQHDLLRGWRAENHSLAASSRPRVALLPTARSSIQGIFSERLGNIQGTFKEHSTFREHSGNMKQVSGEGRPVIFHLTTSLAANLTKTQSKLLCELREFGCAFLKKARKTDCNRQIGTA
jgi:hypothetical protein